MAEIVYPRIVRQGNSMSRLCKASARLSVLLAQRCTATVGDEDNIEAINQCRQEVAEMLKKIGG